MTMKLKANRGIGNDCGARDMSLFVNLLKAICMWPKWKCGKLFSCWYYGMVAFVVSSALHIIVILAVKLATLEDVADLATVVDFLTLIISGFFRCVYVIVRGNAFRSLMGSMDTEFAIETFNETGLKIRTNPKKVIGQRLSLLYLFSGLVFVAQMVVVPLVETYQNTDQPMHLIFDGWYPFDVGEQPIRGIVFLVQTLSWVVMGYFYLVGDIFWYMVIFLSIGQEMMIAHSYLNLVTTGDTDELSGPTRAAVLRCVSQHQKLRRFIRKLENLLNPIIIVDVTHGVLSITFLLLDILVKASRNEWGNILNLTEYMLMSVLHIFVFSFLGNDLAHQESKLCEAMWNIPWYRSLKEMKVPLVMTIHAVRKPCRLTGGKMFYLNLAFFAEMMKTIFSHFTVLLQLKDEGSSAK